MTGFDLYWVDAIHQYQVRMQMMVRNYEAAVYRYVQVTLIQNQFDTLVSFAYNLGNAALQKSTLLPKLNAGDYKSATD